MRYAPHLHGYVTLWLHFACVSLQIVRGAPQLWRFGRIAISDVDAALEGVVSAAVDDFERKTLLTFVRDKANSLDARSVVIRAASEAPASRTNKLKTVLCCFDVSRASRRQLSLSLMQAVGVSLTARMTANKTAIGLSPTEAEAVNMLYAAEVLPNASQMPAIVQVGVWQLAPGRKAAADWSITIGGRGRRVVAGAARWAANLKAKGQLTGVVGAVPTFTFRGNKADILLLGAQCAEVVQSSALPVAPPDEGLGSGIRRAMIYARAKGFIGGLPTHSGDGSLLLLRSACAATSTADGTGETAESILAEHRSAIALANVARWARSQGALHALPTFIQLQTEGKVPSTRMEVILIRPRGASTSVQRGKSQLEIEDKSFTPVTSTLTLAGMCTALTFVVWSFLKKRPTQAERDLEFIVDSL